MKTSITAASLFLGFAGAAAAQSGKTAITAADCPAPTEPTIHSHVVCPSWELLLTSAVQRDDMQVTTCPDATHIRFKGFDEKPFVTGLVAAAGNPYWDGTGGAIFAWHVDAKVLVLCAPADGGGLAYVATEGAALVHFTAATGTTVD